jgi:hypothetical protein
MTTSEILHFAFRASDPLTLGTWYAELFDGHFFIHPVMSGLGIVIVKLNHPEAVFDGLLEFWPWDVTWDGTFAAFRKVEARPGPTSYGHIAVKVAADAETIVAELKARGIPYRMEPRASGFLIPVIDDPEGNMIELFPNIDTLEVPPQAFCPRERAAEVYAAMKARLEQRLGPIELGDAVPLLLFDQP